jgi:hypothetical protein
MSIFVSGLLLRYPGLVSTTHPISKIFANNNAIKIFMKIPYYFWSGMLKSGLTKSP